MKRFISLILVAVFLMAAGCSAADTDGDAPCSARSSSEQFLVDRLGSADGFVLGTADDAAAFGIDMSDFRDEGYVIRSVGDEVVIFGKTESGLDRGVRHYAKYCTDDDYINVVSDEGYRVKAITVAGRDISEYSIYLFEGADQCHTIAANELQKYISLATGITLPIVREPVEHMIVLERVGKEDPRSETLGNEGFNITVKENGDLYIFGGYDRGCLYGVYELLEIIGWRFVVNNQVEAFNDSNFYLYESELVEIPAGFTEEQIPSFEYRYTVAGTQLYNKANGHIRGSAAYNGWGIPKHAGHGLSGPLNSKYLVGYATDAMKNHIEQPCFTNEVFIDGCIDYYTDYIEKQLAAGRQIGHDFMEIELGINDGHIFCKCEECFNYMKLDGSKTGPFLYFANTVARYVGENYPGLQCTILVYWDVVQPPKVTVPEPNINCSFCFFKQEYCTNHIIDGSQCAEGLGNTRHSQWFEKWCEIADIVTAWYYPASWTYNNTLLNYIDVMRDDFRYMAENDICGTYICTGVDDPQYTLVNSLGDELQWNAYMTEEEYRDLIFERLCIFYGKDSAPYIMAYLDWVETIETDGCWMGEGSQPNERIRHPYIVMNHDYVMGLFDAAIEMAESDEAEHGIRLYLRNYLFNYLIAAHSDRYIDGTEEERAEYTRLFDEFKEFALQTRMEYITADMSIEENPATVYSHLYEWEPYWWPLPEGFALPENGD